MTSPASAPIIVNPKMRSSVATTKAFMKPSVYSMASVLKPCSSETWRGDGRKISEVLGALSHHLSAYVA